ncbi:adenylate/guanylate cyclase domain-containing protein [Haloarcula sp. 1CSR25-25]|uniref:adenylate/guanylate cyclase domain-containing protein n=1 Tax=Haloarcula sp. 1CSR25-25 TaxID=2862545 RepID=UPI00289B720D|nr:adenylate/guanylate cyclase domain-containing protein [Haloarcula sp. 1CSR25-25]
MPDLEDMTIHSAKKFRLGTVFIDINNSRGYMKRNGVEDTLFMLNNLIPELMELVRKYDGYFEKNTGDGILAYFGAGGDDEDAVENLLEYLVTVRWTLANHINPLLDDHGIEKVTISAGASYSGNVHISRIGVHSMNRRTAVGHAANSAATLEDKAGQDDFYVNEGINKFSDDENGWGKYIYQVGRHEGFTWGSESSGYSPADYYKFNGIWKGTNEENLTTDD